MWVVTVPTNLFINKSEEKKASRQKSFFETSFKKKKKIQQNINHSDSHKKAHNFGFFLIYKCTIVCKARNNTATCQWLKVGSIRQNVYMYICILLLMEYICMGRESESTREDVMVTEIVVGTFHWRASKKTCLWCCVDVVV